MLCCAPPIFASARDFEAFVNLTQTKGPRTMPSPAECREWVRFPVSLSETASWTVVDCPSKTGCWNVAPVSPRSEERRVGKECRVRWAPEHEKQKEEN